jgi:hypothetical protein
MRSDLTQPERWEQPVFAEGAGRGQRPQTRPAAPAAGPRAAGPGAGHRRRGARRPGVGEAPSRVTTPTWLSSGPPCRRPGSHQVLRQRQEMARPLAARSGPMGAGAGQSLTRTTGGAGHGRRPRAPGKLEPAEVTLVTWPASDASGPGCAPGTAGDRARGAGGVVCCFRRGLPRAQAAGRAAAPVAARALPDPLIAAGRGPGGRQRLRKRRFP